MKEDTPFRISCVIKPAMALAVTCIVSAGLSGFAATDPDEANAAKAVAAVQLVAPSAVSELAVTTSTHTEAAGARLGGGYTVAVPAAPSAGVKLSGPDAGSHVKIGLPFAGKASKAASSPEAGVVVYNNNNGSSTVPVVHKDGTVQISTVINNAAAPKSYDYPMTVPAGETLTLTSNGMAMIADRSGNVSARVAVPWAKDSKGNPVPTHYKVHGHTLTQIIDFSASTSLPIVADPSVTWLWWGRTIKYSKTETRQVASQMGDYAITTAACAVVGPVGGLVCGAVIGLGLHIVANAFRNAVARGRCMQLNIPYVGPALLYEVGC